MNCQRLAVSLAVSCRLLAVSYSLLLLIVVHHFSVDHFAFALGLAFPVATGARSRPSCRSRFGGGLAAAACLYMASASLWEAVVNVSTAALILQSPS